MVTISTANIPTPKSWDEFEDITLSAAKLRWSSDGFFRNGRQGQAQDGVDIWGHDEDGKHIGVQCKNTVNGISKAIVEKEIASAEGFEPKLDRLYVATSERRDAKLQKEVRLLSVERVKKGLFKVDMLFWDDICNDLSGDDDVFFRHYPQLKARTDEAKEHDRKLFDSLTTLLTTNGVIGFLDTNNMAGFSFPLSKLDPLYDFYYNWNQPEREFIGEDLEKLRAALWNAADRYLDLIATDTFPTHNQGRNSVPEEWEETQPDRFWKTVKGLHSIAGEIVDLHRQLVRKGREIFFGKYAE